mgnify:CR=1 FL=1
MLAPPMLYRKTGTDLEPIRDIRVDLVDEPYPIIEDSRGLRRLQNGLHNIGSDCQPLCDI